VVFNGRYILKMDFIFADIFFSLFGRAILFARYRNTIKVRQALLERYDNSYSQAGRLLGALAISRVLLIAFFTLIFATFYGLLRHNLHWL
jgi:hypothetical protein